MEIPSETVNGPYIMDVETEGELENGELLDKGMIVLLKDDEFRNHTGEWDSDRSPERIIRENRHWCKVVKTEIRRFNHIDDYISIQCIYADGWHIKRYLKLSHSWIYKK